MTHRFSPRGVCVDCQATREKVADRRAPPFCPERPEDLQSRDLDQQRKSANHATGY